MKGVENLAAVLPWSATVTPMTARPLPDALANGPFTVATARDLEVGRGRLRGRDLARPTHGVRSLEAPATLEERAAATALALPGDVVFCHSTAAVLHGLPLPRAFEGDAMLHVARTSQRARIRREGCEHHKGLERRSLATLRGLRVTSLADTWADVAADPRCTVDDAVVMADAVVRRGGVEPVMWAMESRRGGKGLLTLRQALPLARARSLSPMETRARLLFERAGLPEPELNADVFVDGEWIARPDFVWRDQRVVVEYDGDHHRTDARQWRNDIYRRQLLEDAGWTFVQLTADDILRRPRSQAAVARLARLLDVTLAS